MRCDCENGSCGGRAIDTCVAITQHARDADQSQCSGDQLPKLGPKNVTMAGSHVEPQLNQVSQWRGNQHAKEPAGFFVVRDRCTEFLHGNKPTRRTTTTPIARRRRCQITPIPKNNDARPRQPRVIVRRALQINETHRANADEPSPDTEPNANDTSCTKPVRIESARSADHVAIRQFHHAEC